MARSRSRKPVGVGIIQEITHGAKKLEVNIEGQRATLYAIAITSEIAGRIIEHCNLRNRKLRQNKVLEWARFMKAGEWQLREQLVMTDSGELLDGQHRILAVSESGVTCPFFLMVVPSSKATKVNRYTDIGVPRNLSDYLHFNGVPDAPRIAPILVYERNSRIAGSPLQTTKGEKTEYLALFREIGEETFKRLFDVMPRGLHVTLGVNRAFLDWFGLHVMGVDAANAELFLGLLADASQLKKTDPPYVLRESLIELQRKNHKVSLVQQAHMTAKAWVFFGEGQPTTPGKIKHRINEDWPGIYGEE